MLDKDFFKDLALLLKAQEEYGAWVVAVTSDPKTPRPLPDLVVMWQEEEKMTTELNLPANLDDLEDHFARRYPFLFHNY
jgi:hypothetical protein